MNKLIAAGLLAAGLCTQAFAASEADVETAFEPYKKGFPTFPGLSAGMTINKDNVD